MHILPICYFPTKTLFVDDDQSFLNSLSLKLPNKGQSYDLFSNYHEALEKINQNYNISKWTKNYIKGDEAAHDQKTLNLNIRDIHKQVYDQSRFEIITTVMVDYEMPDINGLELCNKLKNFGLNIVLLTGTADDKLAIQAFNSGLINRFIPKHSPTIYQQIEEAIEYGQRNYFQNISQIINTSLSFSDPVFNLFEQIDFSNFFQKLLSSHDIVEYYLLETPGTFLIIDKNNNVKMLFINSGDYMQYFYDLLKEEELDNKILELLANKNNMLCYYNYQGIPLPFKDWKNCIYPCSKFIVEGKTYYYTILDDQKHFSNNRILSFERFCRIC